MLVLCEERSATQTAQKSSSFLTKSNADEHLLVSNVNFGLMFLGFISNRLFFEKSHKIATDFAQTLCSVVFNIN